MKIKAIIRITVCFVLFMTLLSILLGGMAINSLFDDKTPGETTILQRSIDTSNLTRLEINWAAGSITIGRGHFIDTMVIKEVMDSKNHHALSTSLDGDALEINFGDSKINLGKVSGKDLIILVPYNWNCATLKINGAALDIDINGLEIKRLELNGASNRLKFNGKVHNLSVEGAANSLDVGASSHLSNVNIEGMGCQLDLKLPSYHGFNATVEGLGVSFRSDLLYVIKDGHYTYGNCACQIEVSGLGCQVTVNQS